MEIEPNMRCSKYIKKILYFSSLIFNSILEHHSFKYLNTKYYSKYITDLIHTTFFKDIRYYRLMKEVKLIPQRLRIKPYWM